MSKLVEVTSRLHNFLGLTFYHSTNIDSDSNLLFIWPSFLLTLNVTLVVLNFIYTAPDWEQVLSDASGMLVFLFQMGSFIHGTVMLFECIFFREAVRNLFRKMRALRGIFQGSVVQESFEKKMKSAFLTHLIQAAISTVQLTLELGHYFFWNPGQLQKRLFLQYFVFVLPIRAFQMPLLMKIVSVYLEMCAGLIQTNNLVFDFNFFKEIQKMLNKIYKITEAINKSFGTSLFFSPISIFLSVIVFVYIFGKFGVNPEARENVTGFTLLQFLVDAVMALFMGWKILIGSSECERMVRFLYATRKKVLFHFYSSKAEYLMPLMGSKSIQNAI